MSILAIIIIAVIVAGLATAVVVPAVVSEPIPPVVSPQVPAAVAPLYPGVESDRGAGEDTTATSNHGALESLPGWSDGPLETYTVDEEETVEETVEETGSPVERSGMAGAFDRF